VCDGVVINTDVDNICQTYHELNKEDTFVSTTLSQFSNLASFVFNSGK
jgi:hypothetical protein